MAPRRQDGRRLILNPREIGDAFACGVEVQDYEDWLRLTFFADVVHNGHAARCKAAGLILPRSALHGVINELRGGPGQGREGRSH